jgi:hypothetical protein
MSPMGSVGDLLILGGVRVFGFVHIRVRS